MINENTFRMSTTELFSIYVQLCQVYDLAHSKELPPHHMEFTYPTLFGFLQEMKIENLNVDHLQKMYNLDVKISNQVGMDRPKCVYWNREEQDDSVPRSDPE